MKNAKMILMAAVLCLGATTIVKADVTITYEGPGLSEEEAKKINYTPFIGINGFTKYLYEITYTNVGQSHLPSFTSEDQTLSPILYAQHTTPEEQTILVNHCLFNKNRNINVHEKDKTLDTLNIKITAKPGRGSSYDFECEMIPTYK